MQLLHQINQQKSWYVAVLHLSNSLARKSQILSLVSTYNIL